MARCARLRIAIFSWRNWIVIWALVTSGAAGSAQSFDFSAAELISKFDLQLKADGGDVTKECKKTGRDTKCTFVDAGFQKSVAALKKLDLANGRFDLKASLLVSEEKGKVFLIIVTGNRGDPMNLFHFIGQFGSLLMAINPKLSTDEYTKEVSTLGLMRGDAAPDIGEPKTDILDFAEIQCNNQHTKKSSSIGCVLRPRF